MGIWKVITPREAENMVVNPIAGLTGSGYGVGGINTTNTPSNTYSYKGLNSYNVVTSPAADNAGPTYNLKTLGSGLVYTVTARVKGKPTTWDWSIDNTNFYIPTLVDTEGEWEVYQYSFQPPETNGATTIRFYTRGSQTCNYYVGHVQVEVGSVATTPIVGDLRGFTKDGYRWTGAPHASSSIREAWERKGGYVNDLSDLGFKVLYSQGIGMPPVEHYTQGMALLPGAIYLDSKVMPRTVDLMSAPMANANEAIHSIRKDFVDLIKPDLVSPKQPTVIKYYGAKSTRPVEMYGVYDSGMELQISGGKIDKPVARFICYDPYIYEIPNQAGTLGTSQSFTSAFFSIKKAGVWSNAGITFNAMIDCMAIAKDGDIVIGGAFTDIGSASGDCIIKYNRYTGAISALGTGCNGAVRVILPLPNGDLIVGGSFTSAGGVANTAYIARWNWSTQAWNALATGLGAGGAAVRALAMGPDGTIYVGGDFLNAGGDANADYLCKFAAGAFSAVSASAPSAAVNALLVSSSGLLYVGGDFQLIGATIYDAIACWTGTAWLHLGTGLSIGSTGSCKALKESPSGEIIVGGYFFTANGVTCNGLATWNGSNFYPFSTELAPATTIYTIAYDSNGLLYVGGLLTFGLHDGYAIWNGTSFASIDIDLPSTPNVYAILPFSDGIALGHNNSGTAVSSLLTTITNEGTAETFPIIYIKRTGGTSATILWMKNESSGETLYLNYALQDGETLKIDLSPGRRIIESDWYGPMWKALVRSSDLANFRIKPGDNKITLFVNPAGSPTVTAWYEATIAHWSSDGAAT